MVGPLRDPRTRVEVPYPAPSATPASTYLAVITRLISHTGGTRPLLAAVLAAQMLVSVGCHRFAARLGMPLCALFVLNRDPR
jgi:hypothetical protein